MTALTTIMDALAEQIYDQLNPEIPRLQVHGRWVQNPTPPAIDVFPAEDFQEALTFGNANNVMFLTVRARVSTADPNAGQDLLLSLMDPKEDTSVAQAIMSSKTLGGVVSKASLVEGPSAFGVFLSPAGEPGNLLGCTWRVLVIQ